MLIATVAPPQSYCRRSERLQGFFGFSPSPDKKLLAIWCVDDGTGKPYIYVVNSDGEVVSDTVLHGQ
jgi:hypothetical protein